MPHSPEHHDRQLLLAKVLVAIGLVRATLWLALGAMYLCGVPFTNNLFRSVAFVALISLYANAATDFGQAAASLAQLAAARAHADAERAAHDPTTR